MLNSRFEVPGTDNPDITDDTANTDNTDNADNTDNTVSVKPVDWNSEPGTNTAFSRINASPSSWGLMLHNAAPYPTRDGNVPGGRMDMRWLRFPGGDKSGHINENLPDFRLRQI